MSMRTNHGGGCGTSCLWKFVWRVLTLNMRAQEFRHITEEVCLDEVGGSQTKNTTIDTEG